MVWSRNKKNNVYLCTPQFYYIKVGFKRDKIIKVCFRDEKNILFTYLSKPLSLNIDVLMQ